MDGYDVRNMTAGQILELDGERANYLLMAGYAVRDGFYSPTDISRVKARGPEDDSRRAEDRFRQQLQDARARIIGPCRDEF